MKTKPHQKPKTKDQTSAPKKRHKPLVIDKPFDEFMARIVRVKPPKKKG